MDKFSKDLSWLFDYVEEAEIPVNKDDRGFENKYEDTWDPGNFEAERYHHLLFQEIALEALVFLSSSLEQALEWEFIEIVKVLEESGFTTENREKC